MGKTPRADIPRLRSKEGFGSSPRLKKVNEIFKTLCDEHEDHSSWNYESVLGLHDHKGALLVTVRPETSRKDIDAIKKIFGDIWELFHEPRQNMEVRKLGHAENYCRDMQKNLAPTWCKEYELYLNAMTERYNGQEGTIDMDLQLTNKQIEGVLESIATLHVRQDLPYESPPIKRLLEDLGASTRNLPVFQNRLIENSKWSQIWN